MDLQAYRTAQKLYENEDYSAAIPKLERLTQYITNDGELWVHLADSYKETGQYEQAITTIQKAFQYGSKYFRPLLYYLLASIYAELDDHDYALKWLEESVNTGSRRRRRALDDEAFAGLIENPRFKSIIGLLPDEISDRVMGWTHDINFLTAEIQRLHPFAHQIISSPAFETAKAQLIEDLPTLDDVAVASRLHNLICLIGDGHSVLYPMSTDLVAFKMLPITYYWFADGVFVVDADDETLIGQEVVAIGNMPIDNILEALPANVPQDNPMTVKWIGMFYLAVTNFLRALGAIPDLNHAEITLKDRAGHVTTYDLMAGEVGPVTKLQLSQMTQNPAPRYLKNTTPNFWFEDMSEIEGVYFQFNQVRHMEDQTIDAFAEQLETHIKTQQPRRLIVDVRHNNGGNNTLVNPLLRVLTYFDQMDDQNQIYVIMGRNTFSACQNFINWVERLTSAIFVGEPSSSCPNFIGESTEVILPYSELHLSISCFIWQDSSAMDDRVWIAPQIPVELSSEAYFNNEDPILDTLIGLI